jgi:hypothetical protein
MRLRSLIAVVATLAVAVVVYADDKEKTEPKVEPAQASVLGNLVCSKCNFKATEKCQTALQLDAHKFIIVSGKAGEDLFKARCSGKLVSVTGALTIEDGLATITSARSTQLKNQVTLAGKLVCSKCDFKIGKCAAALKAGDLQVLLEGDAAEALFKARCSGKPKVATGALTRIEGNTLYLKVSKVVDPKPWTRVVLADGSVRSLIPTIDTSIYQALAARSGAASPVWQPMLAKSFQADTKDLSVSGLVVDPKVGCVFLSVKGKGVFCSSFGANRFTPYHKTWEQVCKLRNEDSRHKFVLTDGGIKESKDGGATWLQPIPLPKGFVVTKQTWLEYDAKHDSLYLMKADSDLYKLARGK